MGDASIRGRMTAASACLGFMVAGPWLVSAGAAAAEGMGQAAFITERQLPAVGDTEHPKALSWNRLACPAGEYVVGVSIRQGGWLAQVGVQCAAPSPQGGWASQPVTGGAAGGEYGSHAANLICPRGRWVAGLAGLTVRVGHMEGLIERLFLADPVLSCGAPGVAGLTTVRDPRFSPEKPGALDAAPARYTESPVQYCPQGLYAAAAEAAVEPEHHPDIKAVRLICAALPSPGDGSGAGAPPVAVRPTAHAPMIGRRPPPGAPGV